ncbi:purine-binding chemotaxis protein CheW [Ligilactobacillus sp. WC1T17]|uniref:Purine-binding chemotaxis protein CheW n=1 Tax=Ligilactobacillus ruminis TaxID=1623 RepID=A0ABY1AB07_9LACO|nr:purine-binding chemotaxis protein CheW [Ligilactobacillus ruminis]
MEQYVVFESHNQLFGLPVTIVRRVVETDKFIPLPEVADYVLGVYEYEEQMLPIIDLGRKLFNEFTEQTHDAKVILCNWRDQSLGIYVEKIIGIVYLETTDNQKDLEKAKLKRGYIGQFLKMDKDVVISLELDYLFNNDESSGLMSSLDDMEADKALSSISTDNSDADKETNE